MSAGSGLRQALLGTVVLILGWLAACVVPDESPRFIEDSTYRIGTPTQGKDPDLFLKVYLDRRECRAAFGEENADLCVPQVNRATGQVRLSFNLLDRETQLPYDLPLGPDHVEISHNKSPITPGSKRDSELVRHDPKRVGQLFIVLIDGSGSMYEPLSDGTTGMDKLYRSLLMPKVKEAFFPKDVSTGVVLMRFTDTAKSLDYGPVTVLESARTYEALVQSSLYTSERGWTHLYDAVRYGVGPILEEPAVKEWLGVHKAEPTVIVLTDGFNNETGADTCRTNVDRLQLLLEDLEIARNAPLGLRPTVFTIGLGRPIRRDFEVPKGRVTAKDLCGRFANETINGSLERVGIDNVSLMWIAERGGGASFVKSNPKGLADVFAEAAAVRYQWYTAYYKVDRFLHRQSFETRIRLKSYADAEATVRIYPSAWIDTPTGVKIEGSKWSRPTPLRESFTLLMPILSALVFLAYLGPASFNARRAITRRARGGTKSPPPTAPPPAAG